MQEYYFTELANGIRAIHKEMNYTKIVHVGIMLDIGSRDEDPEKQGIAHFWEHMAFKGTQKRRSFHIINRLESLGGELNAGLIDRTGAARVPIDHFDAYSVRRDRRIDTELIVTNVTRHRVGLGLVFPLAHRGAAAEQRRSANHWEKPRQTSAHGACSPIGH